VLHAYTVTVTGKVQAVALRRVVQQLARQQKLVGSVQNLPDGNVKIVVQGEDSRIKEFLNSVRSLKEPVKVDDLKMNEIPNNLDLNVFTIIRGDVAEEIDEGLGAGLEQLALMRADFANFSTATNQNFQTLAERYDNISDTLTKVLEQSSQSNNELKNSMDALLKSLDTLTGLAQSYIDKKGSRRKMKRTINQKAHKRYHRT
jgi:acylphosphatase